MANALITGFESLANEVKSCRCTFVRAFAELVEREDDVGKLMMALKKASARTESLIYNPGPSQNQSRSPNRDLF